MKLLLTGASGFVGRHFSKKLDDLNFDYECLNRNSFDTNSLLPSVDVVVHLAGLAHLIKGEQVQREFFQANCMLACDVAKSAAKSGMKRFIYVSSIAVYGKSSSELPISETDPKSPNELYGQSKLAGEEALEELSKELNFELVIVRPALVYGPNAPGNIASLLKLIAAFPLIPLNEKRNQRSLLSVENLVDFLMLALEHPKAAGNAYNVADGGSVSTHELLSFLALGMKRKPLLIGLPRIVMKPILELLGKGKMFEQLFGDLIVDTSLACEELSWSPKTEIRDGLINTGKCYAEKSQ